MGGDAGPKSISEGPWPQLDAALGVPRAHRDNAFKQHVLRYAGLDGFWEGLHWGVRGVCFLAGSQLESRAGLL